MPPEVPAEQEPRTRSRWTLPVATILFIGVAAFIAMTGIESRQQSVAQLKTKAAERAVPTVSVSLPVVRPSVGHLDLPGRLDAYSQAALFARVSGYVASRKVDIGSRVKAGDVLAEIDAPDLDQQLFQAQSELNNAKAAAALANVTNKRYQALLPNSYVSRQAADEKSADLDAKNALVKSAEANVDRLKALSEYKRIVAPFDGIVTVRNTDVGNLINTGSSTGTEMFVVSDTHKLRLYVNVPQNYVPMVTPGTTAVLTVPEHPEKTYEAKVEVSAGAVDRASGTTRMQLVVDNAAEELMPGAYGNVRLTIGNRRDVVVIPASALIFDKEGLRVATVGTDRLIRLKPIVIGRDLGSTLEIASGLAPEDRIVDGAPDGLLDGDPVNVQEKPNPANAPSSAIQPHSGGKG
ncbi:efflux RND transporter periplasmic adaptor subunit [Hyphomicrobium methylovorum]|uniref:efflux RND transporter periplasmic adaptor subunit n=1 Tax=Hyphomicrobium methylovorum TaxID=84 RepID=UPI0015E72A41|nr:efflux RND transporter periplasmic adaptor subunit [Hyphomicrobium methylovorum]MBA2126319.1 efflux RND transporter periplasmic adaptor subunit [Hyphomicrobium methylovorum]